MTDLPEPSLAVYHRPRIFTGYLGWSNIRSGAEFYSIENDSNGRWAPDRRARSNERWGDLLVDEMEDGGASEGCDVIVVAVPPHSIVDPDEVDKAIRATVARLIEESS